MRTSNIANKILRLGLVTLVLVLLWKESKVLDAYGPSCHHGVNGNENRITMNDTTSTTTRMMDENPMTMTMATLQHSRLIESQVFHQQRNANKTVPEIINQTPYKNTSKPYNTSFRGMDLSLPTNFHLRSSRLLYLITPTYKRKTQMLDLTRIRQTLEHAVKAGYNDRLYWIVVEDADYPSQRVRQVLEEMAGSIPFAHRAVKTIKNPPPQWTHKGLDQRNLGLDTVEQLGAEGVVYFMDDDNAYHVQLFHELSYTTHVSVLAVGMVGGAAYERCHVNATTGKVDKLLSNFLGGRQFPIDMAGFAFATYNLAASAANQNKKEQQQQIQNKLRFSHDTKRAFMEDAFLRRMAKSVDELEPLAANCTSILVWHVTTKASEKFANPESSNTTFELMTRLL